MRSIRWLVVVAAMACSCGGGDDSGDGGSGDDDPGGDSSGDDASDDDGGNSGNNQCTITVSGDADSEVTTETWELEGFSQYVAVFGTDQHVGVYPASGFGCLYQEFGPGGPVEGALFGVTVAATGIEMTLPELVPLAIDQDSEPLPGRAAAVALYFLDRRTGVGRTWSCSISIDPDGVVTRTGQFTANLDDVEVMNDDEYSTTYWVDGSFHGECPPSDDDAFGIVTIDAEF